MNRIIKCHYGASIAIAVEGAQNFLDRIDNLIASSDRALKKHEHVYNGVYCFSARRISRKNSDGYKVTIRYRSAYQELVRIWAIYFYGLDYMEASRKKLHHCKVHGNRYEDLASVSSYRLQREALKKAKSFVNSLPYENFMGNMQADFSEMTHSNNEGYN